MSSYQSSADLRRRARGYGYRGASIDKRYLRNLIRDAEYIFDNSVEYLGWNGSRDIRELREHLRSLAIRDHLWRRHQFPSR